MKCLDGKYYVEVKDHRYRIHPTENIILRKRDPPSSLRTKYQVLNETHIRRNQEVIKNDTNEILVKNYLKKKQSINQQQKYRPSNCPSCELNIWIKFDKGYYCKIANTLSTNKNIRLIKSSLDKIIIFQVD